MNFCFPGVMLFLYSLKITLRGGKIISSLRVNHSTYIKRYFKEINDLFNFVLKLELK